MPISNWSKTAASNNSSPPNGAPEGWAPSQVNDTVRQQMADHRTQWEGAEWFNWGDVPTYVNATSFTIPTDVTTRYLANRRIQCADASTLYGTITSSSYSNPNTTINVSLDSGSLSASLTAVSLGILSPTNLSVPATIGRKGATIASASTTDLSAGTGDFIDISGTTTINSFGTVAAGVEKTIRFTGALTLTYNATSMILPGSVNITTANGDIARFRSLGSGNWVCTSYIPISGANVIVGLKGADIASATTTDLSTATGDFVNITGTTTITGLGTLPAGIARTVKFTGALTLTYNASSLILPGAANITTAAGDTAIFRSLGSGNWICISYITASGKALVVSTPFTDASSLLKNSSDATKLLSFSLSGITTGTTRTATVPDRDFTMGRNWEFIGSQTASNSATLDFTSISASSYSAHVLIFDQLVPATDGVVLYLRFSTSGTFDTGSDYKWSMYAWSSGVAGQSGSTGDTSVHLSDSNQIGTGTGSGTSGSVYIFNASASNHQRFRAEVIETTTGGTDFGINVAGRFTKGAAIDGIRLLMSSGNISSGTAYLYGIRTTA